MGAKLWGQGSVMALVKNPISYCSFSLWNIPFCKHLSRQWFQRILVTFLLLSLALSLSFIYLSGALSLYGNKSCFMSLFAGIIARKNHAFFFALIVKISKMVIAMVVIATVSMYYMFVCLSIVINGAVSLFFFTWSLGSPYIVCITLLNT